MQIRFFPRPSGIIYVDLSGPPVPMSSGKNPRRRLQLTVFKKESGIKIDTDTWDTKKQRVTRANKSYKFINGEIGKIENAIWELVEAKRGSLLTRQDFEQAIAGESFEKDFWGLYNDFLAHVKKTKADKTYKMYVSALNRLRIFSDEYHITLKSCNTNFFDKLTQHLHHAGLANSSAKMLRAKVITFLKWAKDRGHDVPEFKVQKIKQLNKTHATLTREEVERIEALEVSDSLQKVKDLFLWCVYTSMRFGDTQAIRDENIVYVGGVLSLAYYPQKTKREEIVFHVDEKMQAILDRYESGYTPLPRIGINRYDQLLKTLASAAGIDSPVQTEKMVGNKITTETKKKYELISSHTARRTAVTIWAEMGHSFEWMMQRTGHSNFNMIKQYISQTREAKVRRDLEGGKVRRFRQG